MLIIFSRILGSRKLGILGLTIVAIILTKLDIIKSIGNRDNDTIISSFLLTELTDAMKISLEEVKQIGLESY